MQMFFNEVALHEALHKMAWKTALNTPPFKWIEYKIKIDFATGNTLLVSCLFDRSHLNGDQFLFEK